MYAQQSTSTQSSTQQSSTQQSTTQQSGTQQSGTQQTSGWQTAAAGADSQQGPGNQALLEDAGIGQQDGEADSMLGMVLDCLPLEAAVPMAAEHIEDPAVQAWANQQDLLSVARVAARWRPDLLQAQWPAGLGVSIHGTLGGALGVGGDIEGVFQVLRVDGDSFRLSLDSEFQLDTGDDDLGFKAMVEGVDADAANGVGLGAGFSVGLDIDGRAELTMPQLILAGLAAVGGAGAAALLLMGVVGVLDLVDDAGWIDVRDHVDLPDFEFESRAFFDEEARARAALTDAENIPGAIGAAMGAIQSLLRGGDDLVDLVQSARMELVTTTGMLALRQESSVAGLLELSQASIFEGILDPSIVTALIEGVGAHARTTLVLPCITLDDGQGVTVDASAATLTFELGAQQGETAETDSMCVPLPDLPQVISTITGAGELTDLLGAAKLTRQVELPADPAMVDNLVADLLGDVVAQRGGSGLIGGTDSLRLVGSLTSGAGVLGTLASAGIQAPPEVSAAQAILDVHDALCALATSSDPAPLAGWLSPWADTIAAAAQDMVMDAPRLQGELLVGMGRAVGLSAVKGASAKARGLVGIVVDQPVEGQADADVREALARGVFRDMAEAEQTCEGQDVLDDIDGGTCDQEETPQAGSETETAETAETAESATQQPSAQGATPQSTAEQSTTEQSPTEQSGSHADTGTETVTSDASDKNGKGDDAVAPEDSTADVMTDKNGKDSQTATAEQSDTTEATGDTDKNGKDARDARVSDTGADAQAEQGEEDEFALPSQVGHPRRRPAIGQPPAHPRLRR